MLGLHSHFGCVNSAAVNMSVQISVQYPAFGSCGYIRRSGISGLYDNSVQPLGHTISFSKVAVLFYIPSDNA